MQCGHPSAGLRIKVDKQILKFGFHLEKEDMMAKKDGKFMPLQIKITNIPKKKR